MHLSKSSLRRKRSRSTIGQTPEARIFKKAKIEAEGRATRSRDQNVEPLRNKVIEELKKPAAPGLILVETEDTEDSDEESEDLAVGERHETGLEMEIPGLDNILDQTYSGTPSITNKHRKKGRPPKNNPTEKNSPPESKSTETNKHNEKKSTSKNKPNEKNSTSKSKHTEKSSTPKSTPAEKSSTPKSTPAEKSSTAKSKLSEKTSTMKNKSAEKKRKSNEIHQTAVSNSLLLEDKLPDDNTNLGHKFPEKMNPGEKSPSQKKNLAKKSSLQKKMTDNRTSSQKDKLSEKRSDPSVRSKTCTKNNAETGTPPSKNAYHRQYHFPNHLEDLKKIADKEREYLRSHLSNSRGECKKCLKNVANMFVHYTEKHAQFKEVLQCMDETCRKWLNARKCDLFRHMMLIHHWTREETVTRYSTDALYLFIPRYAWIEYKRTKCMPKEILEIPDIPEIPDDSDALGQEHDDSYTTDIDEPMSTLFEFDRSLGSTDQYPSESFGAISDFSLNDLRGSRFINFAVDDDIVAASETDLSASIDSRFTECSPTVRALLNRQKALLRSTDRKCFCLKPNCECRPGTPEMDDEAFIQASSTPKPLDLRSSAKSNENPESSGYVDDQGISSESQDTPTPSGPIYQNVGAVYDPCLPCHQENVQQPEVDLTEQVRAQAHCAYIGSLVNHYVNFDWQQASEDELYCAIATLKIELEQMEMIRIAWAEKIGCTKERLLQAERSLARFQATTQENVPQDLSVSAAQNTVKREPYAEMKFDKVEEDVHKDVLNDLVSEVIEPRPKISPDKRNCEAERKGTNGELQQRETSSGREMIEVYSSEDMEVAALSEEAGMPYDSGLSEQQKIIIDEVCKYPEDEFYDFADDRSEPLYDEESVDTDLIAAAMEAGIGGVDMEKLTEAVSEEKIYHKENHGKNIELGEDGLSNFVDDGSKSDNCEVGGDGLSTGNLNHIVQNEESEDQSLGINGNIGTASGCSKVIVDRSDIQSESLTEQCEARAEIVETSSELVHGSEVTTGKETSHTELAEDNLILSKHHGMSQEESTPCQKVSKSSKKEKSSLLAAIANHVNSIDTTKVANKAGENLLDSERKKSKKIQKTAKHPGNCPKLSTDDTVQQFGHLIPTSDDTNENVVQNNPCELKGVNDASHNSPTIATKLVKNFAQFSKFDRELNQQIYRLRCLRIRGLSSLRQCTGFQSKANDMKWPSVNLTFCPVTTGSSENDSFAYLPCD